LRIFLVEDHEDTRRFLTLGLKRLGHEVLTASTAGEAEKMIPGARCDVLISDIGLPDGDGWELLEGLHGFRPPVAIAMSGFGTEADVARSMSVGFRKHLVKPFPMDALKALLAEAARELENGP